MIQIINPSDLVNGYILNGVANFTQSTNPSTRIGGGALVVGDRLYRTDLRMSFFWSGVTWLCEKQELEIGQAGFNFLSNSSGSGLTYIQNPYCGRDFNVFYEKIVLKGGVSNTSHDAANNWSIRIQSVGRTTAPDLTTVNTFTDFGWNLSGNNQFAEIPLNTLILTLNNDIHDLRYFITKNGTPSNLQISQATLIYRLAAK